MKLSSFSNLVVSSSAAAHNPDVMYRDAEVLGELLKASKKKTTE
jgi:hypothetical protein